MEDHVGRDPGLPGQLCAQGAKPVKQILIRCSRFSGSGGFLTLRGLYFLTDMPPKYLLVLKEHLVSLLRGDQHVVISGRPLQITLLHQLADVFTQQRPLDVLHNAVGGKQVVFPGQQGLVLAARQNQDEHGLAQTDPVLALYPADAGENLLCGQGDVLLHRLPGRLLLPLNAVAAIAAAGSVGLSEVVQQGGPETVRGLAVVLHLPQALGVPDQELDLQGFVQLLPVIALLDQIFCRHHVPGRIQQNAVSRGPVPSGAARLLVIAFDVLGHVVVDDKADVGLVDAHAEGVGGHHDGGPVIGEVLLVLPPLGVVQSRMIAGGGKAGGAQLLAYLLHGFPGGAVDDAALVPAGLQIVHEPGRLVPLPAHVKEQIGAVKARDNAQGLLQLQKPHNVLPHLGGGGGGKGGKHRSLRQTVYKGGNVQIVGAEVLPPLADTVRLIHRKQRDPLPRGKGQEAVGQKTLWGHVDQPICPKLGPAQYLPLLGGSEGGIEEGRRDASLLQGRHLVLHQGDQRRHHQRQPLQQQGRNLIAQALPASGGHDPKGVPPGQNRVNQRLLPVPKGPEPKVLLQNRLFVHLFLSFHHDPAQMHPILPCRSAPRRFLGSPAA